MPNVVASIEARMSASRLPGKVLMDICGKPALERLVDRLHACTRVDGVIVATTTNAADDAIAEWAARSGTPCHRGSEHDVLDRVVQAHRAAGSEVVVEICGDTPLLDPAVVDQAVARFQKGGVDVVCNVRKLSWPQGVDAQVFGYETLAEVSRTITDPAVREHVSLYFYENPDRYRIHHMTAPADQRAPDIRLQMDYPEDLELIRSVYERLEPDLGPVFGVGPILALLDESPDLAALNAHCEEKPIR